MKKTTTKATTKKNISRKNSTVVVGDTLFVRVCNPKPAEAARGKKHRMLLEGTGKKGRHASKLAGIKRITALGEFGPLRTWDIDDAAFTCKSNPSEHKYDIHF